MEQESSFEIFDSAIRQALKNYWNHQAYEDMYQECYLKILDVLKNNTYEPVYNLYGYAYKIARNAISTYMYHANKVTTLSQDEFPEVAVQEDFDSALILEETLIQTLHKFKNTLPSDFTLDDLKRLIFSDKDPNDLLLQVVKGEVIWELSKH